MGIIQLLRAPPGAFSSLGVLTRGDATPSLPHAALLRRSLLSLQSTWHRKHRHRFIFIGTVPGLRNCFSLEQQSLVINGAELP